MIGGNGGIRRRRSRRPTHTPMLRVENTRKWVRANAVCHKRSLNHADLRQFLELAETVGFEPTCRFPDNRISSAARCDHFDTFPSECILTRFEKQCKKKMISPNFFCFFSFFTLFIFFISFFLTFILVRDNILERLQV